MLLVDKLLDSQHRGQARPNMLLSMMMLQRANSKTDATKVDDHKQTNRRTGDTVA